jgi:O-antigen ligase
MLGTGTSARYSVLSSNYFVLDNVGLAIFLYSGLIGLLLFLLLYAQILWEAMRSRRTGGMPRWDPMIAFFACLLIEGMFVDNHNTIFVAMFAMMGMLTRDRLALDDTAHSREMGEQPVRRTSGLRA